MARLAETVAALLNSPMSLLDLFHFIAGGHLRRLSPVTSLFTFGMTSRNRRNLRRASAEPALNAAAVSVIGKNGATAARKKKF